MSGYSVFVQHKSKRITLGKNIRVLGDAVSFAEASQQRRLHPGHLLIVDTDTRETVWESVAKANA